MKSIIAKVPNELPTDQSKIIRAARTLPSSKPRILDLYWDGSVWKFCLTAQDEDLQFFYQTMERECSVTQVGDVPLVPEWLSSVDPELATFFVISTTHGNAFASVDPRITGFLLTPVMGALESSSKAWLQVEFYQRRVVEHLNRLGNKVEGRKWEIDYPGHKYNTWTDEEGKTHSEKIPLHHHWEGNEFHKNYDAIRKTITTKAASSPQVITIVRGLSVPQVPLEVGSGEASVVELPVGGTLGSRTTISERLSAYTYHDPRMIIDLAERRVIEPNDIMASYQSRYLSSQRENLPFMILSPDELSVFVSMPDAIKVKVETARTGSMSRLPSYTGRREKEGTPLGEAM